MMFSWRLLRAGGGAGEPDHGQAHGPPAEHQVTPTFFIISCFPWISSALQTMFAVSACDLIH